MQLAVHVISHKLDLVHWMVLFKTLIIKKGYLKKIENKNTFVTIFVQHLFGWVENNWMPYQQSLCVFLCFADKCLSVWLFGNWVWIAENFICIVCSTKRRRDVQNIETNVLRYFALCLNILNQIVQSVINPTYW